jgi:hypothetical protein
VLTPVALLSERGDRFVWRYASSLYVMNETYRREYDAGAVGASRWLQELAASAWAWLVAGLVLAGHLSPMVLAKVYLVVLLWVTVNQVRTLAAHRYANDPDRAGSYLDQLLDTNTFPNGKWLPELWAPLGLRYHALHHLLPMLPYHAMRDAHGRLMALLPPDSPYHETVRSGLWSVVTGLLRRKIGEALDERVIPELRREDTDHSQMDHGALSPADRPAVAHALFPEVNAIGSEPRGLPQRLGGQQLVHERRQRGIRRGEEAVEWRPKHHLAPPGDLAREVPLSDESQKKLVDEATHFPARMDPGEEVEDLLIEKRVARLDR